MKDSLIMSLLFAVFFGLYVHTAAPHVAPYRDAGEMVVLANTLGVAHPPGYPLYTLLANIWRSLPIGNPAYRLNVFSALSGTLAVALLFLLMRTWAAPIPAVLSAVSLGLSSIFWELSVVSEMYALGAAMLVLVFLAMFRWKSIPLTAFLFALALGVRMDLLLFIPLLFYWAWTENKLRDWKMMSVAGVIGGSIFLYMMVRSLQNPLLDWGNPDNLQALFNSMSRKSYASTLDLLSLNYKQGENFPVNISLYTKHLLKAFSVVGIILVFQGVRKIPRFFIGGFLIAGPLFLFMANMPPNPHALAIVEASYLLPDIFVAIFIGFGLSALMERPTLYKVAAVAAAVGLLINLPFAYTRVNKRNNFYAQDYIVNLFRSAPAHSVVVLNKDVQIFSTWVAQVIDHRRPDLSIVPAGLSASAWYWEMRKRWPVAFSPNISFKEPTGWQELKATTRPIVSGFDVEDAPPETVQYVIPELCITRGLYRYGETPDFFSTDLIGDHARAYHRRGLNAMNNGRVEEADWFFARASTLDPTMSRAASDRGYLAYTQGQFAVAKTFQTRAVALYLKMLEQAKKFNSLPPVVNALKSDLSSAYLNLGVSTEKSGDVDGARLRYSESMAVYPNAQAHYNMAVTYWGRNWPIVLENLEACLRINPQFPNGAKFLALAQMKAAGR